MWPSAVNAVRWFSPAAIARNIKSPTERISCRSDGCRMRVSSGNVPESLVGRQIWDVAALAVSVWAPSRDATLGVDRCRVHPPCREGLLRAETVTYVKVEDDRTCTILRVHRFYPKELNFFHSSKRRTRQGGKPMRRAMASIKAKATIGGWICNQKGFPPKLVTSTSSVTTSTSCGSATIAALPVYEASGPRDGRKPQAPSAEAHDDATTAGCKELEPVARAPRKA